MRVVSLAVLAALTVSSPSLAQDVSEPGSKPDRIKVIDYFPLPSHPGSFTAFSAADTAPELFAPLEDTFLLHSNPGASKVIYLDFDGHTIMWLGEEFYYDPWNREGPDTTFSDAERTIIQLTWQSISEDFLPFDLDITTEDPGVEALRNTGGDDEEWGIRAVINHSTDTYSWAYSDSFTDSEDTELYAWSGDFSSVYETWIWLADSVVHEAGHSLGLGHDGTTTGTEYYRGHGSGDTAWSPVMGWTNYGLSQWSRGEYTDANNHQDDLHIITTRNGFGYRPDDHGSTTGTATAVDVDVDVDLPFVAEGIIEQTTDVDYFAFTIVSDGYRLITVSPDNLNPNLDIAAHIYDSGGAMLFASNPPTALDAEFDVFLSAGDYYLSVDGTGYDDPDSDGYSDYGTLGYYIVESYVDEDGDGFDDLSDCDDGDATVYPGATEYCDGLDNDCDGSIDEEGAIDELTWHIDADDDGFGSASITVDACDEPEGYVAIDGDCDDSMATAYPGAAEYCDGYDNDCDGEIDEAEAEDSSEWYTDFDHDGYAAPGASTRACDEPGDHISADDSLGWDCDDSDPSIYPGAEETWYDDIDSDCDGESDWDADGDGYDLIPDDGDTGAVDDTGAPADVSDCDDEDPDVYPDAEETWYDGVDGDCDEGSDFDADGDGHDSDSYDGDDCDDADAETYPDAPDVPGDGIVTDCDASDEYDADGDGYDSVESGGDDCDDTSGDINPGAEDIPGDGIDQDCDGEDATVEDTAEPDDPDDSDDTDDTDDTDDSDDSGDSEVSDDSEDSKDSDAGASCSCTTGNAPWSGLMFLVPLFLVRRRELSRRPGFDRNAHLLF